MSQIIGTAYTRKYELMYFKYVSGKTTLPCMQLKYKYTATHEVHGDLRWRSGNTLIFVYLTDPSLFAITNFHSYFFLNMKLNKEYFHNKYYFYLLYSLEECENSCSLKFRR